MINQSLYGRRNHNEDNSLEWKKGVKFAGRFRLLGLLGKGGFGEVWQARDLLLKQTVAIKISTSDLTKETLILRQLPKDRYVSIFDYVIDKDAGSSAYSMELLEEPWITLDDYQGEYFSKQFKNPMKAIGAAKMAIYVGIDLLKTLCELHGKKYGKSNRWCHADIKPQNLYIHRKAAKMAQETPWGDHVLPFLKVGDLGLARQSGSFLPAGTPRYMAPEQNGSGCVSPATDVFSVGQTLAAMITGDPFEEKDLKHVTRMKTVLARYIVSAHLVDKFSEALRRMMALTPAQRPTGEDTIRLLRGVMASEVDWKILSIFMRPEFAEGITLVDAADILFDVFAPSRGWNKRSDDRIMELKSKVKSMCNRNILSRNGHKYSVRS